MRPFTIRDIAEFNDRAREVFRAALGHYGITAAAWCEANGRTPGTVAMWLAGRRQASMEYVVELLAVCGCRVVMEPPAEFKPVRKRMRGPKRHEW